MKIFNEAAEDVKNSCLPVEVNESNRGVDIDRYRDYKLIDELISNNGYGSLMNISRIPKDLKISEADLEKNILI